MAKYALFWPKRQEKVLAKGQYSPHELEVSPRSGLYLLVIFKGGSRLIYYKTLDVSGTPGLVSSYLSGCGGLSVAMSV